MQRLLVLLLLLAPLPAACWQRCCPCQLLTKRAAIKLLESTESVLLGSQQQGVTDVHSLPAGQAVPEVAAATSFIFFTHLGSFNLFRYAVGCQNERERSKRTRAKPCMSRRSPLSGYSAHFPYARKPFCLYGETWQAQHDRLSTAEKTGPFPTLVTRIVAHVISGLIFHLPIAR